MLHCCSGIAFLRLLTDYEEGNSVQFVEADIRNHLIMATNVVVNHDRSKKLVNLIFC